ncbi:MAG: DUF4301 family protein [Candidatus Cyclobacteriaceae bacterium M3_2C_046]
MLTNTDLEQIKQHGVSQSTVNEQIERFKKGFPYINILKAATIGNGILKYAAPDTDQLVEHYESMKDLKILKFVPASGAASRMFKSLFSFLEAYKKQQVTYQDLTSKAKHKDVYEFLKNIEHFAFFYSLKNKMAEKGDHLEESLLKQEYDKVLQALLDQQGLNYGNLPKGLLEFHKYDQNTRTPVEEHLVEGANYARSANDQVHIHFTVSPDFMDLFQAHIAASVVHYEQIFKVKYQISFSIQKPSTDTIAVDLNNQPFRDQEGSILFRPGGHGSLLENLNEFDHDIIFIKNIDNVVPDQQKGDTYTYKKALAGTLLKYQQKVFKFLEQLEKPDALSEETLDQMLSFVEKELNQVPSGTFSQSSEKIKYLKTKLNRPIRVCGMVKNEGEPGGGPYWAENPDKSVSLQVVESSQVNMEDSRQHEIFHNATHFNPVDLVISPKNFKGGKFDLLQYRDPETGFISRKSKDGQELKALELPGLWNGSMSDWITLFVEVPISTFNPVKTVNDLLRESHCS